MIAVTQRTKQELILLAGHHAECLAEMLEGLGKGYLVDHRTFDTVRACLGDVEFYLRRLKEKES